MNTKSIHLSAFLRTEADVPKGLLALLAMQAFSAYLTGTKFLPEMRNNVGAFEVTAVVLFVVMFLYFLRQHIPIRVHPLILMTALLTVVASVSLLLTMPAGFTSFALIQLVILYFMVSFFLFLYNVLLLRMDLLKQLLRYMALAAIVAGVWTVIGQDTTAIGVDVVAAGPFRNRVHLGIAMLTAFWLTLMYGFWPDVPRWERYVLWIGLPIILFGAAVSGRRTVYFSLAIGLVALSMGVLVAYGRERLKLSTLIVTVGLILGLLLTVGPSFSSQLAFFRERLGMVDDRLAMASEIVTSDAEEGNFLVGQFRGGLRAFNERPLFGIGYGGFFRSDYSPTGHEMHGTPMRFLAETGIVGFSLYVTFMGYLLFGSVRMFLLLRKTPYQLSALVQCVALWSMSVSYIYNRHITERTFWFLVVIFMGFETWTRSYLAQKSTADSASAEEIYVYTAPTVTEAPRRDSTQPAAQPTPWFHRGLRV